MSFQAINVTPYIDILLVLLIIFMVITPFTSRGIPARLPADRRRGLPCRRTPRR